MTGCRLISNVVFACPTLTQQLTQHWMLIVLETQQDSLLSIYYITYNNLSKKKKTKTCRFWGANIWQRKIKVKPEHLQQPLPKSVLVHGANPDQHLSESVCLHLDRGLKSEDRQQANERQTNVMMGRGGGRLGYCEWDWETLKHCFFHQLQQPVLTYGLLSLGTPCTPAEVKGDSKWRLWHERKSFKFCQSALNQGTGCLRVDLSWVGR